MRSNTDMLAET